MRTGCYNLIGLALGTSAAFGFEASDLFLIQKGRTALKPQFELTGTYNDNVSFREEDKLSDFITVISPGLAFQIGSQDYNYFDISYFFDRVQYLDHDEFSANQHRVAIQNRFEKSRFLLEGRDTFESLSSPLGGGISLGGQRVDRNTFADHYRLTYDLSERTGVYGEATHQTVDFDEGLSLFDSLTLIGTLGFEYHAFSRTTFFGEVYYGQTENDPNIRLLGDYPTARFVGGFLGVRGSFTEQLTGTVKAGYESRDYSDDTEGSSAPVVEATLTERFSEGSILSLSYSRRQRESVQFLRSVYVADTVGAHYLQHIGHEGRLRGELSAVYSSFDYEDSGTAATQGRHDQLATAGLTITYDVKLWMRAFGSYNFEYLDSNVPVIADYKVNRFTLGMQLGY